MLPTFFVIGAARCGTTSLHYYLDQHPDIGMAALKEPNFFLFDSGRPCVGDDRRLAAKSISDRRDYERLVSRATGAAIGDASPLYLYCRETPSLIASLVPDARLVAVLREPIARAYSHFAYVNNALGARLPDAFAAAVREELPLAYSPYVGGTHFLRLGRYAEQVERYLSVFGEDQLLLVGFDDLADHPDATLARICRFLGVDAGWHFDTAVHYNPAGGESSGLGRLDRLVRPAAPYLKRMLPPRITRRLARQRQQLKATGATARPPMSEATRDVLRSYYAEDSERLAELTGVSFAGASAG